MEFSLIGSRYDWEGEYRSTDTHQAQNAVLWADHLAILYPLWFGDMPALLKGFFEQVMRPGFAFRYRTAKLPQKLLKGRSARVFVTMNTPALLYRLYYGAHSVKSLERNILRFVGISPIRHTLIGNVEASAEQRAGWIEEMHGFGEDAA